MVSAYSWLPKCDHILWQVSRNPVRCRWCPDFSQDSQAPDILPSSRAFFYIEMEEWFSEVTSKPWLVFVDPLISCSFPNPLGRLSWAFPVFLFLHGGFGIWDLLLALLFTVNGTWQCLGNTGPMYRSDAWHSLDTVCGCGDWTRVGSRQGICYLITTISLWLLEARILIFVFHHVASAHNRLGIWLYQ